MAGCVSHFIVLPSNSRQALSGTGASSLAELKRDATELDGPIKRIVAHDDADDDLGRFIATAARLWRWQDNGCVALAPYMLLSRGETGRMCSRTRRGGGTEPM